MSQQQTHAVLVVDDDLETAQIIRRVLERQGHRVDTLNDPQEALQQIRERDYAVVLSDVMMPRVSGTDLTQAVLQASRGTQVILMTGYSTAGRVLEAYRAGASDFLLKPFADLEEVGEAVALAVRRHERWAHAFEETRNHEPGAWR